MLKIDLISYWEIALLGKTDSFNHKSDDICEYNERVDQYFFVNDIDDAKKKTAIFLTVIGSDTHSLLKNLLALVSLSTKTVEKLFKILKEHLTLQQIVIAAKYMFYCRDQNENETISDCIAVCAKVNLKLQIYGIFRWNITR